MTISPHSIQIGEYYDGFPNYKQANKRKYVVGVQEGRRRRDLIRIDDFSGFRPHYPRSIQNFKRGNERRL